MIYKVTTEKELIEAFKNEKLQKKDKIVAVGAAIESARKIYDEQERIIKEKKRKARKMGGIGAGLVILAGVGVTVATGGIGGVAIGGLSALAVTASGVTMSAVELGIICGTVLGLTGMAGSFVTGRKFKIKKKDSTGEIEFEIN